MPNRDDPAAGVTAPSPVNRRIMQLAGLNAALTLVILGAFATQLVGGDPKMGCTAQIIDFHAFWSAARLSLEGAPLAVFDPEALRAVSNPCDMRWLPWLHPAPVLTLVTPFGLLPILPAWLLFNLVSLTAFAFALGPFTRNARAVQLGILFAPALLPALLSGQFTLLWMAALLGAFACLTRGQMVLAGVLIGLLTLKPTLGLLIPAALLAIRAWRTILSATVTTIALHGGATLLYGSAYWQGFRTMSNIHAQSIMSNLAAQEHMSSLAAILARLFLPGALAVQINLAIAAVLAILVYVVWRRFGAGSDRSYAVLVAAIPLASPYLWLHDTGFLALSALFLFRLQHYRTNGWQAFGLVLIWLGAGMRIWLPISWEPSYTAPAWTVTPLLLLALAMVLAQVFGKPEPSGLPSTK